MPSQCSLSQVIGEVRGSSEQYSESISMRFPREILLRHCRVAVRPIRVGELREAVPELLVDFLPCGFEKLSRDSQRYGPVRVRDEHAVEFGMKSFSNPEEW